MDSTKKVPKVLKLWTMMVLILVFTTKLIGQNNYWTELQKIKLTGSVLPANITDYAMNDSILIIGAAGENNGAGAVYFYRKTGSTFVQKSRNVGSAGSRLGSCILIGNGYVFAGAPRYNSPNTPSGGYGRGAVYFYNIVSQGTSAPSILNSISLNDTSGNFGIAMAMVGTTLYIGANNAYGMGRIYYSPFQSGTYLKTFTFFTLNNAPYTKLGSKLFTDGTHLYTLVKSNQNINTLIKIKGPNFTNGAFSVISQGTLDLSNSDMLAYSANWDNGKFYFTDNTSNDFKIIENGQQLTATSILSNQIQNAKVYGTEPITAISLSTKGLFASYLVKESNNDTFINHKISNRTGIPKVYNNQVFLAQDSFVYVYQRAKNLLAFNKNSDANLHFSWFMDARCSNRQNLPVYVQLFDVNNNKEVYAEIVDSLSQLGVLTGSFTYKVSPEFSSVFRVKILEYGNGNLLCQSNDVNIGTVKFKQLSVNQSAEQYHQIEFNINNISEHADKLIIYRDGRNYKVLDIAPSMNFIETVNKEINNGTTYNYCFQLANSITNDTTARICVTAKTTALQFKATDNTLPSQVDLSWKTIPSSISTIKILRDGKEIAQLQAPLAAYTDYSPVAGHKHLYTIQLFDNELILFQQDTGSIKAKGELTGYVLTNDANAKLGIANVTVKAVCTILGKTYTYQAVTNANGEYTIKEMYFFGNSSYTITANKGTHKFTANSSKIDFNEKSFRNQLHFNSDLALVNEKKFNFTISNLTFANQSAVDGVKLTWNLTTSDTVFYQIYRNEILIGSGFNKTNSTINFMDITGIPKVLYNYKIKAYSLIKNKYFTQELTLPYTFPDIEGVANNNFNAVPNNTQGVVDLNWTFNKTGIEGFIITRNSEVIAKVNASVSSFRDYLGENGKSFTYGIVVFAKKSDGNFYQSNPTEKSNILFPILPIPTITTAESFTDSTLKINFNVNNAFYYHKLILTRKFNTEIDTIGYYKTGSNNLFIVDEYGVNNRQYSYELRAIKGLSVSAPSVSKNFKYPDFPKIISVISLATQKPGLATIEIKTGATTNLHQLEISVDGTNVFTGDPKLEVYHVNLLGKTNTVSIKTRIIKTVKNIKYSGTESSLGYTPLATGSATLPSVSKFTASKNQLNQVLLQWDYPNYIVPKFYLYRDGILYDSAMHSQRNYLDKNMGNFNAHLYQIIAVTPTAFSPIAGDYGSATNNQTITGLAYNHNTKSGVAHAKIVVRLTNGSKVTFHTAYTNEAGYFIIQNPEVMNSSTSYFAIIQSSEGTFNPNSMAGTCETGKNLVIHFLDNNVTINPTENKIASIQDFTGTAINVNNAVNLSWNLSNENYTGVELYRGMNKLTTVLKSQINGYVDLAGAPGYSYTYRLVPYWNTNGEQITGNASILRVNFPVVFPVENLVVSSQYDEVALRWSHPSQNFDYIKIIKNGNTIAKILAKDKYEFIDKNGVGGHKYNYQLTAIKIAGSDTFESFPMNITGTFPNTTQAQNLVVNNKVPSSSNVFTFKANVTWFNASRNLDSATLIVNGIKEKTVKVNFGNNAIISTSFIPGQTNTYTIVQNNSGSSSKPLSVNFANPVFSKPIFLSLSIDPIESKVVVGGVKNPWESEGMDSIQLLAYRGANLENPIIGVPITSSSGNIFGLRDVGRQSGISYNYRLRFVSWRNGVRYLSAETPYSSSTTIPNIWEPYNLKNIDSTGYGVTLQWEHARTDLDSFEIFDNNISLGKVGGGIRQFTFSPLSQCVNVKIIASKKFSTNTVVSAGTTAQLQTSTGMKILIPCNSSTSQFGRGLKMEGNKAVILAPNSNEVFCYGLKPAGWVLIQKFTGTNYDKLAMHNNTLVLGSTGSSSVKIYEYDGEQWQFAQTISNSLNIGDVAIFNDRLVISQPSLSSAASNGGGFKLYKRDNAGNWNLQSTYSNPTANELVGNTNMAINDKVIVASNKNFNTNRGKLWAYTYDNNGVISNPFLFTTGSGNNNYFASSIDLDGDTLLVGNLFYPTPAGSVNQYLYTSSPSFNLVRTITPSNVSTSIEFGFSVAKMNGAALIGAPTFNSGTVTGGWAASSITSNTSTFVINSGALTGYTQGTSVDAVGNWFLISSPSVGTGRVHYLERTSTESLVPSDEIITFTAGDGTFANKVFLSWTESVSNNNDIDHFDIFRDGQKIDQTANSISSYNDLDAIPGKKHLYSIAIVYASGIYKSGIHKSDIGFAQPNGNIYGKVVNLQSAAALSGVTVIAEFTLPEGKYYKTASTDLKGEFNFDNLYYNTAAQVKVSVKMLGATFQKDVQEFELTAEIPKRQVPDFYETSGYSLIANMKEFQCNCGIDSLPVTLFTYTNVGSPSSETRMTAKDGKIGFSIAPKQANILKYVVKPAIMKINGTDTIWYKFNADSLVISNPNSMAKITQVSFENQITIPIDFVVGNSCGAIGINTYTLSLETANECFKKTITTNSSGTIKNVKVPPVAFNSIVVNTLPNNSANAIISEYFSQRPVFKDLTTIYAKESKKAKNNTLSNTQIDLTYHVFPEVSIVSGMGNMCEQADKPYIVEQDKNYNITLGVTETFGGIKCSVGDGYLVIKNTAAQEPETRIELKKGKSIKYSFVGGDPAITYPFIKGIVVEYWNASNEFVSNTSFKVVVTGTSQIPGTDFIIENDENELQWPLMILRDPAGDESYSFIENGETNTLDLSVENEIGGDFSFGITQTNKIQTFSAVVGGVFDTEFTVGGSSEYSKEFGISTTTNQRITSVQTSFTPNSDNSDLLAGPGADVIVGNGTAIGYGVAEQISISNCQIFKKSLINIQPNGITTQWVYTVDFIKNLIRQYDSLITNAELGNVEIEGGTIDGFRTKKANWESILQYHFRETTPMFRLCDISHYDRLFPINGDQNIAVTQYMDKAKEWAQNCFCGKTEVGSYIGDSFIMVDKIAWNNELLTKFKKTRAMVERYLEAAQFVNQLNFNINDPATAKGLRAIEDGLISYSSDAENNLLLTVAENSMAENTSFSGGTSIDKESTIEQSYSNSFTSNFTLSNETSYALVAGVGIETRFSTGLGVEIEQKGISIDFENNNRIINSIEFTLSKSTEKTKTQTSTSGYHLEDNDLGDQFSITAIKGIEKNHSPYFITLGGRSTCPSEPETIYRDNVEVTFEYPDGTPFNPVQRDLDPNKPAFFPLKLSSLAPTTFYEHLWYRMSPNTNTNRNGATISTNGNTTANYDYLLTAGQPVFTNVMVTKNPVYTSYPDLGLYLGRICNEGYDIYNGANAFFEAHFRSPCSNVSIIAPADNWVIKKATTFDTTDLDETLPISFGDYDLNNPLFESVTLQYRRVGSNNWNNIAKITKAELQTYYNQNRLVFKDPRYIYYWKIQGDATIIDGNYEIRAQAFCGTGGFNYSKNIAGKIDRRSVEIFGKPQPADGILSNGDEISVDFNKQILCGLIKSSDFIFTNKNNGDTIEMIANCLGNKIVFTPVQSIGSLDGISVLAKLISVSDVFENTLEKPIEWTFDISNNPLFILPKAINYAIYKGNKESIDLHISNTQLGNYSVAFLGLNLAQIKFPNTTGNITPAGLKLSLGIDATTGNIGTYFDTLFTTITSVSGYSVLKTPIQINVLPTPTNWSVNTPKFESSTSVICNFEMNGLGVTSEDTMDRIAVSILGEVRGFANIIKVGKFYRAYVSVYGNTNDVGRPLNFRIWHAATGIEYDAKPRENMVFDINAFYGTTPEPRILDVQSQYDSARFIPLQKGWNWLAFNTVKQDASVANYLQDLKQRKGAKLKTMNTLVSWNDNTKEWISLSNGISEIKTSQGYMLYVPNADTLRVSGIAASKPLLNLNAGWNLIGNTNPTNVPINSALYGTGIGHLAKIKGRLSSPVQFGDYDSASKTWNGITTLLPNQSYMLKNGKIGIVQMRANDSNCNFTPNQFEYNTTFFAIVKLDNVEMSSSSYSVKAFIDGKCAGFGNLEYNVQLKRYAMNLFVYSNKQGKKIEFAIVDEVNNKYISVPETVFFNSEEAYGTPENPYIFSNVPNSNHTNIELKNNNKIQIYPTPVKHNSNITILSNYKGSTMLSIYDLKGRKLASEAVELNRGENTCTLHSNLTEGMYLLQLEIENETLTFKIIVE